MFSLRRRRAESRIAVTYLAIGLASAAGGVARYGIGAAFAGIAFPWGTISINASGSLIIGLLAALTAPDGRLLVGTLARQTVMTGFCGGYTTFSAFSLESVELLRHGRILAGAGNVALSLVLCLAGVWLGHVMAARLNR